jgi:hypothetical protein
MSNYTPTEVQAAVENIVRSTVRHPTGILGDRKIAVSFSDIQEAAAGVYILWFNAPFYTLSLGARRLADALQTQASTAASLIDAIFATDRLVTPVKDLSPLANARSALQELEAAVSSRIDGFPDITNVPAYRRYVQNLDGFLNTVGPNIKEPSGVAGGPGLPQYRVVDTPSGARSKIPALVRQLVEQHAELIRKAKLLAGAVEDFGSLNLPRIAAQGVISRARDVLDEHYTNLSALDENTRLDSLREVVLDLLTQKPLVQKYGAAQAPGEFINTSGLALGFADAEHPAEPAAMPSDNSGPYPILADNQFIRFAMNGEPSFDYPLPLSFIAEINGILQEPFQIDADRDALLIGFGNVDTGLTQFPVTLTNGLRSAAQVAAEINAALGASALVCEETFYPVRYSAPVVITSLGGNNARFTILAGNLISLGVTIGDEVDINEGANDGTTWVVTGIDLGGQFVDTLGVAPVVPVPLPGAAVEIGPAARALRLRDTDELGSVVQRRTVRIVSTGNEENIAAAILGFYPGAEARSRPVAASAVVDNINSSTAKLTASLVFHAFEYTGAARSEPTDPTRVVLSKADGTGSITGGTTVTLTIATETQRELLDAGDALVLRSSSVAADVGSEGIITAVADDTILVTFATPISPGDVIFEVGPGVDFGFGDVVVINDGPNAGRYVVGETQGVRTTASFECALEGVLPNPKDGELPIYFNASLGAEDVTFSSRDTTLASQITIDNAGSSTGAEYFLDPFDLPRTTKGNTSWLQFAVFPSGASVGDNVQLYEAQYNLANREIAIVGLESDLRLIELDETVPSTFSLSFDFNVATPFGRIRIAQVANYSELKEGLDAWLARSEQQELYFRDLARFLNPIVTNANPTVSMVNDATNHLKKLLAVLTEEGASLYGSLHVPTVAAADTMEFALASYQAPAVEPVDTLLSTFRQKGADRAIDLLLEGQFSVFFNLDVDGVSYSGALMSGLRDLAREDLPIRKFDRRGAAGEKLISSSPDERDFEFSSDDADSPGQPDAPASPDVASPGENY